MRYSAKPAAREEAYDFFDPWSEGDGPQGMDPVDGPRGEAVPLQTVREAVREAVADAVGGVGVGAPLPIGNVAPELELVLPDNWCRDDDPADFLRDVGIPTILGMTMRLQSARHRAALQDLLSLQPPALRLLMWLWPGPMDSEERRTHATLEFVVERTGEFGVSARYWTGRQGLNPILQSRVPVQALREEWVSEQVVEFLERALGPVDGSSPQAQGWTTRGPMAASS